MQSPTWQLLKKANPSAHIAVWVAPRGTRELAEAAAAIDQVIEAPPQNSLLGHLKTLRTVRRHAFDSSIVLTPGQRIKSALHLYAAQIPQRIGHRYRRGNNPASSFLLTEAIPLEQGLHDLEQNLRLLGPLVDYDNHPAPQHYTLNVPQTSAKAASLLMQSLNVPAGRPLIGIHPGSAANSLWKRWPEQNFAALGSLLIEKYNAHLLVFGGREEKKLQEKLGTAWGNHSSLIATTLLDTAALMQQCQLVVANDSGLMHVAAAASAPTLGLFGPTDEHRVGPRGPESHVIRANTTSPVYDPDTNYQLGATSHSSMLALTPQAVFDKIAHILRR